ncbi:MAG: peptidoglycan-associated lipoprotein Pal [Candidatus Tectomicrobia bacterium]|uniref:Peptidoglycan-associated protein n=1 Tax=Tectimicrobiota bacterium TaxID=2528274 RepID=A0A933GMK3_UNCTE|nr:peptidoglycan-associated lipoprotein Pal [Candidatus Tectomicrobia bacterium]
MSFQLSLNLGCTKKTQVKEDQISGETMGKGPGEGDLKLAAKPAPGQIKMDTERVKESGLEDKPYKDWKSPLKDSSAQYETNALADVNFDYDKANLSEVARQALAKNGAWLKDNKNVEILIEGHCDERGTEEYNLALGEKRAMTVKSYLVTLGIDANRLFTISYGKEKPVDPGHNDTAWAKNRRAHFVITSK